MELLSYLYILFDLGFLSGSITSFALGKYYLGGGLLGGFFLYPWVWEPLLMIYFRTLNCCVRRPYKDDFDNLSERGCNLVYHPKYNMKLCGIEKRHPFDSCKYERVINFLYNDHKIRLTPDKNENQLLDESEKSFLFNFSTTTKFIFNINHKHFKGNTTHQLTLIIPTSIPMFLYCI
jgi:hypothetical protein